MIHKYVKKPVVIEAIQLTNANPDEVLDFMGMLGKTFAEGGYGIDPEDESGEWVEV